MAKTERYIGGNIRRARLDAGLTQEELADRLGVGMMLVSRWERGTVFPSGPHVVKLVEVFGCDLVNGEPNA